MAPSSPTSVPTSSPTFDFRSAPIITDKYGVVNAAYYCHRRHLHSTPNPWRRIFGGLSIESKVYIKALVITVTPYNADYDEVALKLEKADFSRFGILTTGIEVKKGEGGVDSGVLTYNNPGIVANLASDWNRFLNLVIYRLNLDELSPVACDDFIHRQGYHRKVSLYVLDRYNRRSNIVSRNVDFKTAGFVFSNAKPVKINNRQSYITMQIPQRKIDEAYYNNPKVN